MRAGAGTGRTRTDAAGTARTLRGLRGRAPRARGVRAWHLAVGAGRTARMGAAAAPGTQASCLPVAAGTGSAARAAPAGPAPRWGDSLRSSDGLEAKNHTVSD